MKNKIIVLLIAGLIGLTGCGTSSTQSTVPTDNKVVHELEADESDAEKGTPVENDKEAQPSQRTLQYVWDKYPELTYDDEVMDDYMKEWVENLLVDNIDYNAKIAFVDLDMHKLMTWEDGFIPYGNGYEVAIYYPSTHMLQIGIEPKVDGDDYTAFFPFKVDNPVIGYAYDYSIIVQPSPDDAFYYVNGDRFEDGGSDVFDEATWYNIYV